MPTKLRLVLAMVALLFALLPASSQATACQFGPSFASLLDAIPDLVGSCVADEQINPLDGNRLQTTRGGLLVASKLARQTTFTNGAETWLDGPLGLQKRSNNDRFWWEPNPDRLPVIPPPIDATRLVCQSHPPVSPTQPLATRARTSP